MYRILIAICLFMPLAGYCQESGKAKDPKAGAKKKDEKSAPKPAAAPESKPAPDGAETVLKMPDDVVEVRPDIYRRVDEKGKAWIYRRTPFGIQRSVETEFMKNLLADPPDKQIVKELPDGTLEFSKQTPWGIGKYIRKKEDLTPDEMKVWQKAKNSGSQKKDTKDQLK